MPYLCNSNWKKKDFTKISGKKFSKIKRGAREIVHQIKTPEKNHTRVITENE